MNNIYNLQKGINYTTILKTLKFNWKRFWNYYPKLKKYIFNDTPVIEYGGELYLLLKINPTEFRSTYQEIQGLFAKINFCYNLVTINDNVYSSYLKYSLQAPVVLFTRGNVDFMKYPAVSVVGTRKPTEDGKKRARKLALLLADMGFVIVSGLAKGIDTAAHTGALRAEGRTIAVIGTNIGETYPAENKHLQETIAESHLLISQFPFGYPTLPYNFPLRNQTMSGLSLATIVVEAGETSGALIQARQCLRQKRKLFILKNLIDNPKLVWPKTYKDKEGVYIVEKIEDLVGELQKFKLVKEPDTSPKDLNYDLFKDE